MKNLQIILIVLVLAAAGGGFFAGMKYQEGKQTSFSQQGGNRTGNQRGQFPGGGNRNGFRPVTGEILSRDDTSITVKLQDGSSKIVLVSDKTQISKASEATKTDLTVGTRVAVFGQDNSDGSVTAQNIQLNPIMRGSTGASGATPR